MLTSTEFKNDVMNMVDKCPDNWRKGQAVFNVIDAKYNGLGREIQFEHHCDCFYNDDYIDEFIELAYKIYTVNNKQYQIKKTINTLT